MSGFHKSGHICNIGRRDVTDAYQQAWWHAWVYHQIMIIRYKCYVQYSPKVTWYLRVITRVSLENEILVKSIFVWVIKKARNKMWQIPFNLQAALHGSAPTYIIAFALGETLNRQQNITYLALYMTYTSFLFNYNCHIMPRVK